MTPEQETLVLTIVSRLNIGSVTGEWPHEKCKYCSGSSEGYYDDQDFRHEPECIVLLIHRLKETLLI